MKKFMMLFLALSLVVGTTAAFGADETPKKEKKAKKTKKGKKTTEEKK